MIFGTVSGYSSYMPAASKLKSFAPNDLATYHRNPNLGNPAAIEGSLRVNSQYRPIVVNRGTHTGRPNEVLAGNHTLIAIRNLLESEPHDPRWRKVEAYVVDVDDDAAARIVLADNKTAQSGFGYDEKMLADILDGLPSIEGTAFTQDEYSDLLASLEEALPDSLDPAGTGGDERPPRIGEDGLIASTDIDDQAAGYAEASTRIVVLTVPIPQFVWMQEILTRYRDEFGLESNTAAVVRLLEDWSGRSAPTSPSAASQEEP